jgi:hypothetical protein
MYTFERLIFSLLFNKVPKNPKLSQPRPLPSTVVSTSLVLPPIVANGPRKPRHAAPVRLLADAQGIADAHADDIATLFVSLDYCG